MSLSDVVIDAKGQVISTITMKSIGYFSQLGVVANSPEKSPILMYSGSSLTSMSLENGVKKTNEVSLFETDFFPSQLWAFKGVKGLDLLLYQSSSLSLVLQDQTKVKWRREEALGHAENAVFVDLPGESLHAHNEYFIALTEKKGLAALPGLFLTRVATQIQTLIAHLHSEPKANLIMDNFGFNKLLLVATSVGKLFAIHSMTGETVWMKDMERCQVQHFASLDIEQVALVAKCGEKSKLVVLSVVSGETVMETALPSPLLRAMEVEKEDYKVLLLIGNDLSVTIYPNDEVSKSIISQQHLVFYMVNKHEGTVQGYRVTSHLTCILTWNILLPASEHITAYKSVTADHIQQPAIATGLSKLLYKYIDSSLFVLATMKMKPGAKDGELTVYLVNGVAGRILSKIKQDGVNGRVTVDCDENWAVVHYWSSRTGRYEFLSIELFEHKVQDSAWEMILSYLENPSVETVSAYSRPSPVVLHQSYATTTGFQAMDHTLTLQGITRQDLVLIMNSGQLLTLDRRQLSPRRKPEEDHEVSDFDDAMLPPYKPLIPLVHTNILTHDRQVEGLQHTTVTWALLESTCFVASYGLDLFVARVMPEKSFDMLTDDFNYSAIVISLGVMVAATIVAEVYFKKNQVKRLFAA